MSQYVYIEDVFIEFYNQLTQSSIQVDYLDITPIDNFYYLCSTNKNLTEKQANFIIRLLKKYKSRVCTSDFDYTDQLTNKKFKNSFRVIDHIKKVFVDLDENNIPILYLQFPYSFKETFDNELCYGDQYVHFFWDETRRARKTNLFDINFLQLYSFVTDHGFVIDESFQKIVSDLEQVLAHQENIIPYSVIEDNCVNLKIASKEVLKIFSQNQSSDLSNQMFTAKTMGYPIRLLKKPKNLIEKIASSESNTFWLKDITDIFNIYKILKLKITIIIDRAQDNLSWLNEFLEKSKISGISSEKIKVCFRESKTKDTGVNQWIKDNNLGGKLDGADILVFQHVPPKWIFNEENFAKIVVTTMITPPTSYITADWLTSHPCVIYLSEIKPTRKGKNQIVEL